MTRRRLFSSRRNGYGGDRSFGGPEMRNAERELFLFRRRLVIAGVGALLVFIGLFARFVYLQVYQHEHYRTLAESNRVAIVPIVPNRGVITDRNGIVLAQSYSAYTLELTPSRIRSLDATIDELATIVDIQPRDRKRFRKLLEESKNFESLPLRTRLSDEEVARFAVNRYRFPGVDIKARLFRQYPYGEIASHVLGYIGRINDRDVERIAGWEESANYKGSDYIGKVGRRAFVRARTARHDRRGGSRGGCRGARRAHAVAHAAGVGQQPAAVARHQAAGGRGTRVRRPPRCARRDRAGDRRHPRVRVAAGLRPQPVRRRHRHRELGGAQRIAGQAAAQPAAARRVPAGLHHQAVPGARRAGVRQAHAAAVDRRPGILPAAGIVVPVPRRQAGRPRHRGHVQVDRRVLRHLLLRARQRDRHRRQRPLPVATLLRAQDRRRHRGRADRRAAVARVEARALRRREVPRGAPQVVPRATRSPPASGRATTRSRRCSSRTRPRSSPTTASRSGRIWSRTSST